MNRNLFYASAVSLALIGGLTIAIGSLKPAEAADRTSYRGLSLGMSRTQVAAMQLEGFNQRRRKVPNDLYRMMQLGVSLGNVPAVTDDVQAFGLAANPSADGCAVVWFDSNDRVVYLSIEACFFEMQPLGDFKEMTRGIVNAYKIKLNCQSRTIADNSGGYSNRSYIERFTCTGRSPSEDYVKVYNDNMYGSWHMDVMNLSSGKF